MSFDPAAKAERYQLKLKRQREKKAARAPKIPAISMIDEEMVRHPDSSPEVIKVITGDLVSSQQDASSPSTVDIARGLLQRDARFYVRAHKRAIKLALQSNELDVARKGAAEMIKIISDGKSRIVDPPDSDRGASNQPIVQLGIVLGGMPLQGKADPKQLRAST